MTTESRGTGLGASRVLRFGVFQVDLRSGELHKRGVRMRLQQQPFQVLEMLLERPGEVVLREELRRRLWPSDTWVDFDHGLNKAVNKLRETLGDSADNSRFVETLTKRGYRFVAPVEVVADAGAPVATSSPPAGAEAVGGAARDRGRWRTAAIAAGVALTVALMGYLTWWRIDSGRSSGRTMVAVLPFANIASEADDDYLSDGITEELILQVGRLSPDRLSVIARTSSMHYKGAARRIDEIGRELGVHYVLEGTVRRSAQRVRIGARLVRCADQTPLWAESYDRNLADVFDIQSDVAKRIASSLAIELLPAPVPASAMPRAGADAYDAYLKGRYHWNRRTPVDLERALMFLEQAVSKDPSYAPAHAAMADALNVLPWYGLRPPREAYPRSKEAARKALALDDSSAAAHTALAYAYHYYDWTWGDAEREYQRALDLNPNYAQAHQWLAAHYAELGHIDDALAEMQLAQRLDPRSTIISAAIGWINYLGRRYTPAIEQLRRTLDADPEFVPARLWLGQALEATGDAEAAIEQYLRVRQAAGRAPSGLGELARGYAAAGRHPEARATLTALLEVAQQRYVEADLLARAYEALGETDRAIAWLEQGFEERAVKMVLIGVDPQYDRLRGDTRFQNLVRRLHLPQQRP